MEPIYIVFLEGEQAIARTTKITLAHFRTAAVAAEHRIERISAFYPDESGNRWEGRQKECATLKMRKSSAASERTNNRFNTVCLLLADLKHTEYKSARG